MEFFLELEERIVYLNKVNIFISSFRVKSGASGMINHSLIVFAEDLKNTIIKREIPDFYGTPSQIYLAPCQLGSIYWYVEI